MGPRRFVLYCRDGRSDAATFLRVVARSANASLARRAGGARGSRDRRPRDDAGQCPSDLGVSRCPAPRQRGRAGRAGRSDRRIAVRAHSRPRRLLAQERRRVAGRERDSPGAGFAAQGVARPRSRRYTLPTTRVRSPCTSRSRARSRPCCAAVCPRRSPGRSTEWALVASDTGRDGPVYRVLASLPFVRRR